MYRALPCGCLFHAVDERREPAGLCPIFNGMMPTGRIDGKILSRTELAGLGKILSLRGSRRRCNNLSHSAGNELQGRPTSRALGPNQYGGYTEDSGEYQVVLDRLKRKSRMRRSICPTRHDRDGRKRRGHREPRRATAQFAKHSTSRRQKIGVDYLRVKAFPFNNDVEAFLKSHSTIFRRRADRDAQLKSLLTLETAVEKSKLYSILSYSGFPYRAEAHRQRHSSQSSPRRRG